VSVKLCLSYTLTEAESLPTSIPTCCVSCWLLMPTSRNIEDDLQTSCRSAGLDLLRAAGLLHNFLIKTDSCCLSFARFSSESKTSASRSSLRLKKWHYQNCRKGNMLSSQTLTNRKDYSLCWNGGLVGVSTPSSDILKEHIFSTLNKTDSDSGSC